VIDNPISSIEKSLPYPGAGVVKPMQHSEKDKERAFADLLEETLKEEDENGKTSDQDSVALGGESPEHRDRDKDEWIPSDPPGDAKPKVSQPEVPGDGSHLDLKA
jgi:hypothetical protein